MSITEARSVRRTGRTSAPPATTGGTDPRSSGPMVGLAIRLPVATLEAARSIASTEGVKVTSMLRQWIDERVAERMDDERVVSVSDLRRLIAHRSRDETPVEVVELEVDSGAEVVVLDAVKQRADGAAGKAATRSRKPASAKGPGSTKGKNKPKSSAKDKTKPKGKRSGR